MNAAVPPLSPQSPDPSHEVLEQAAEWFALLRSGEAGAADRAGWQAWLDGAAEHRAAWACVERISDRFAPIQASADPGAAVGVYRSATGAMARRRRTMLGIAACAGSGLLGWAAWRHTALPGRVLAWAADHRTAVGEVREIALADGSRVWLGTASGFDEDYGASLRRLRLVAGEIMVRTATDASRPFVVDTAQGRLRALGTRFSVRLEDGEAWLTVFEGAVEARAVQSGRTAVIPAGRQARLTSSALLADGPANPAREAWTRGVLVAHDRPLGEVVRELARYHTAHLAVAPEVAGLPVFGSYPATDPDRALAMLESVMPIRVRRPLPWWVSIGPRDLVAGR